MLDAPAGISTELTVAVSCRRLDSYLASALQLPRARARRMVEEGAVIVDGRAPVRPSLPLSAGMRIEVVAPAPASAPSVLKPRVVYQDDAIVVIDKPAGLVVHPAPGHRGATLVDALPEIGGAWSSVGGDDRPGIVHRLDRGTSGLLVLARSDRAHERLARQLRERTMGREYWALASGGFEEDRGRVEAPIGRDRQRPRRMSVTADGRPAGTEFFVLERLPQHSCLRLRLWSGRTHQIRVHLAFIGHAVVDDALYSTSSAGLGRPALHAAMLHLRHPLTEKEMVFHSPLPSELVELRHRLGGEGAPVWPWDEPGAGGP